VTFKDVVAHNPLYPLTDRAISGLPHHEQIRVLAQKGIGIVQLREKHLPSREFYLEALAARRVANEVGIKLIINDRVDIALAIQADGVHLGQDDLPAEAARQILGTSAIIGVSTHNLAQARIASQMPVDYVAVGPIFATSTKAAPSPTLGLGGLRRIRGELRGTPLVAIGGITKARFTEVLEAGADALAVISDLWRESYTQKSTANSALNSSDQHI
jgi:thiamine-phosphate pyrophosphorylase